ncbi:MAG: SH3 domain-containing protein [Pseudonocardiaceae bacterium]
MAKRQHWYIGGGVAVAILLLVAAHNSQDPLQASVPGASGTGSCRVTVTADSLNVRSGPDSFASVVQTYRMGEVISADRTVLNDYRQLGPDRWAAQEYLDPTPGSNCG